MMSVMDIEARRGQLGEEVRARRDALLLSKEGAARRGSMDVQTWTAVEDGRSVRANTYAKVEVALEWKQGTIREFLAGGTLQIGGPTEGPDKGAVADAARLLELVRDQFGKEVYEEAKKVVDGTQANTKRVRRNHS